MMKRIRLLFTLLLLLMPVTRLSAQWSGSVDASGGYGAVKSLRGEFWEEMPKYIYHGKGETGVRIDYKSPTFQWSTSLKGSIEKKGTDNYHITAFLIDDQDDQDGYDMNAIVKVNEELPVNGSFRTDITWKPAPGRRFDFWARYNMDFKESSIETYKGAWKSRTENYSEENPVLWDQSAAGGLRATLELGAPRQILSGEFSFDLNDINKVTTWTTVGIQYFDETEETGEAWIGCYQLHPHSQVTTFKGNVNYRDSLYAGAMRMLANPGIRFTGITAIHENEGAVLDVEESTEYNPIWRDSTEIREWFHFASLEFQPYFQADLTWRKFRVRADYGMMLYARRLTDSTHFEKYKWQRPYLLGNGRIDWKMAPQHTVSLSHSLTIKHPTYLQVCWFDRSGGYMEQLYRGSEALRSTRTRKLGLNYEFRFKRFVASSTLSYSRRLDEVEQTWFKEEIDDRTYKVFTWMNGADSRIYSPSLKAGWRGQVLTANLGVDYNYTVRTWRDNEKVKISTDWRLTADVAARLQKGWTLSADVKYQSAVSTFFALFKQYCVLNARVQKDFPRFSVFLQGRDLLDQPVESEYISEDQTEYWTESTLYNRRIVLLGFSWKF